MRYKLILLSLVLVSFSSISINIAFSNTLVTENIGFPTKNIWISNSSILEGEEVTIHAIVINDFEGTFYGRMEYYDRKEIIGDVKFSVNASQKIKIISLRWIATAGSKVLSAKIIDSKIIGSDNVERDVKMQFSSTSELVLVVRADKNKNGISDTDEIISTSTLLYADSEIFDRGIEKAKNVIPDTIKIGTKGIFSNLDSFRVNSYKSIYASKIDNINNIDALNLNEITSKISQNVNSTTTVVFGLKEHTERPLRYVYWLVLVIVAEILSRSWLFYIFVFTITYFIIRYLWRKIRGK